MPSPFPGMDPFIEGQVWKDFHHAFIGEARATLIPQVRPRYVVRVEERVYLDEQPDEEITLIEPDVMVVEDSEAEGPGPRGAGAALAVEPVILSLPMPAEQKQRFLALRERETLRLVTVIEILSPTNKRGGSDGRRQYLEKRKELLRSSVHLVELDLLRGGRRLPVRGSLPAGDYFAFVARAGYRPRAEVYAWTMRQPLPTVPVPLAGVDPDAALHLQAIFTSAYDRAGYDYSLDYRRPVEPPLGEADAAWTQEILAQRSGD
jgi:hypothetical protein